MVMILGEMRNKLTTSRELVWGNGKSGWMETFCNVLLYNNSTCLFYLQKDCSKYFCNDNQNLFTLFLFFFKKILLIGLQNSLNNYPLNLTFIKMSFFFFFKTLGSRLALP